MKHLQVLGSGCSRCVTTAQLIERTIKEKGVEADVEKVTDPEIMMRYRVMATPAVVVDGKLVHSGSIPKVDQILSWLV
jgi:small redox-active disulfide protein 2